MDQTKIALVTGASSGIGQACAEDLARHGYRVYGTSRQVPAVGATDDQMPSANGVTMLRMDVDDDASVSQAVEFVLQREARIDAVINAAGFPLAGAIEEMSVEEAKAQFETNFFGLLRVCQAVLPAMRAQGAGYVVNISSVAAAIPPPFHGMYSATKAAIEAMSQAMRLEVKPHGVRVVVVEPGDCSTQVSLYRRRTSCTPEGSVYSERCDAALCVMEADEAHGLQPIVVARAIRRALNQRSPRLRYVVASPFERLATVLVKILPSRLVEWLVAKYYKV